LVEDLVLTTVTEEYDGQYLDNFSWKFKLQQDRQLAGAGTQTAGLGFGGGREPITGATEEYNGATWTTSPGSMVSGRRYHAGCRYTNSSTVWYWWYCRPLYIKCTQYTEEYNGTSWEAGRNFTYSKKYFLAGLWYSNSRFSFWWFIQIIIAATEEYNGTSWVTAPGSLNTARRHRLAGCGTQTAAVSFWW
jgi:hypothetical protein